MGAATAKNVGRGRSKAPFSTLQPLGEIPLQICCRCNDENSPLQFRVAVDGGSRPLCFPERPSALEIERVVMGFE